MDRCPHGLASSAEVESTVVDQEYLVPLSYYHVWV